MNIVNIVNIVNILDHLSQIYDGCLAVVLSILIFDGITTETTNCLDVQITFLDQTVNDRYYLFHYLISELGHSKLIDSSAFYSSAFLQNLVQFHKSHFHNV